MLATRKCGKNKSNLKLQYRELHLHDHIIVRVPLYSPSLILEHLLHLQITHSEVSHWIEIPKSAIIKNHSAL